MTYEEVFAQAKSLFMKLDAGEIKEHLAYQINITGEGEGAFYIEVQDGRLNVQPYTYYDRDAVLICSAETLLELAAGKMDPVLIFMQGKLRVEGSMEQALKLKKLLYPSNQTENLLNKAVK